jgi:hypothetical protein
MNWRIYRVPGSQKIWHIDNGPGTQIINVRGFELHVISWSVENPEAHPRAWIELPYENTVLHILNGVAIWDAVAVAAVAADIAAEPATPAPVS